MAFDVRFNFLDSRGRSTSRSFHNTNALVADVVTQIGVLLALWNVVTDLQFLYATIMNKDAASAFAGAAVSNVDENTSCKVIAGDGKVYDVNLPDVPDAKHPGESLDMTDVDVANFFAEFAVGKTWRLNLNNPTEIVTLVSGQLDK